MVPVYLAPLSMRSHLLYTRVDDARGRFAFFRKPSKRAEGQAGRILDIDPCSDCLIEILLEVEIDSGFLIGCPHGPTLGLGPGHLKRLAKRVVARFVSPSLVSVVPDSAPEAALWLDQFETRERFGIGEHPRIGFGG
jgi:hypothetical protein